MSDETKDLEAIWDDKYRELKLNEKEIKKEFLTQLRKEYRKAKDWADSLQGHYVSSACKMLKDCSRSNLINAEYALNLSKNENRKYEEVEAKVFAWALQLYGYAVFIECLNYDGPNKVIIANKLGETDSAIRRDIITYAKETAQKLMQLPRSRTSEGMRIEFLRKRIEKKNKKEINKLTTQGKEFIKQLETALQGF